MVRADDAQKGWPAPIFLNPPMSMTGRRFPGQNVQVRSTPNYATCGVEKAKKHKGACMFSVMYVPVNCGLLEVTDRFILWAK